MVSYQRMSLIDAKPPVVKGRASRQHNAHLAKGDHFIPHCLLQRKLGQPNALRVKPLIVRAEDVASLEFIDT